MTPPAGNGHHGFGSHPARRVLQARYTRRRRQGRGPRTVALILGLLALMATGTLLGATAVAIAGVKAIQTVTTTGPLDLAALSREALPQTTRIYDRTGTHVLATIYTQNRDYVPYSAIPSVLVNATVAAEDRNFWTNEGIDIPSIARAALNDVAGGPLQGASTITEQLVKKLITGSQPTLQRKIREAMLGMQASQALSKQKIMELYLNTVYFGEDAYGAAVAARTYFDEPLGQLTLPQAALLAGVLPAPSSYDPFVHLSAAIARQHYVLQSMVATNAITAQQAAAAERAPLGLKHFVPAPPPVPWFTDRVIAQASKLVGGYDALASCGCKVITTLDWGLQKIAQHDVTSFVAGLPTNLNVHNGALVAQDPSTGQILAYVGSVNPSDNSPYVDGQFDSAGVALRSPGSTWKLVTMLAAMQYGHLTDTSTLWDIPIQLAPGFWGQNSENDFNGLITIRQDIRESRNVPAMEAMLAYGGVPAMEQMAYKLGLTTPFPTTTQNWPTLAIGSAEVHLTDMVEMYATESNLGLRVSQNDILRIEKADGSVVQPPAPTHTQVIDPGLAWEFLNVLQDNTNPSKGWLDGPFANLGRPAAVKSGTSSKFTSLTALGMIPQLVAGVWMGNANDTPMNAGLLSDVGALVLWKKFMADAIALKKYPAVNWPRPSDLVPVQVCANLGEYAGYGFDVNGPGCPFGTATSWVIPGFNDPATQLALRPKPFGTYLTDGKGHQLPTDCITGVPETGILAQTPVPAWQPYLNEWVAKAKKGKEDRGGYQLGEKFPWSTVNWILPPTGTSSCAFTPPTPSPSPSSTPALPGSSSAPGPSGAPGTSPVPGPSGGPGGPPPAASSPPGPPVPEPSVSPAPSPAPGQ